MKQPTFFQMTEYAILLQWQDAPSRELTKEIHTWDSWIKSQNLLGFRETIPAFTSLSVVFDPKKTSSAIIQKRLSTYKNDDFLDSKSSESIWEIPVWYADENDADVQEIMRHTGKSYAEIVEKHQETEFWVGMIGFLPGFLYLSGWPDEWAVPRKSVPSPRVLSGSVAIAGTQSGIYPQESPGGWHVLGRTPIPMFESSKKIPVFASVGDSVIFRAINEDTFQKIRIKIHEFGLCWTKSDGKMKVDFML